MNILERVKIFVAVQHSITENEFLPDSVCSVVSDAVFTVWAKKITPLIMQQSYRTANGVKYKTQAKVIVVPVLPSRALMALSRLVIIAFLFG